MTLDLKKGLSLLMWVCCFSLFANDNDRIYIEHLQELFKTTTVYPQAKGEFQFTLSGNFDHERDMKRFAFSPEVEYGLTDHWQVGIEWEAFVLRNPDDGKSTRRMGDIELGTQYSFMNIGTSDFHAAIGFELGIPVGSASRGLTEGLMEYTPYVVVARDFPNFHHIQLFAEARLSFVDRVRHRAELDDEEEEGDAHELGLNFGFLYPTRTAVFSAEFSWEYSKWNHDGDDDNWFITPGVTFKVGDGYEVGLGSPIGLKSPTDRVGAIVILTKEF